MDPMPSLDWLRTMPLVRDYRARKYRRRFAREGTHNLFYGAYSSFDEARADAPPDRVLGYDHPQAAEMYEDHLDHTWPEHYPVLFRLAICWTECRRVLDFGGHRGALYYAAHRSLGEGPEWWIHDVAAVVEAGRATAEARGMSDLRFAADLADVPQVDLAIAAGSLQYVEDGAQEWIRRVGNPRGVILNATPFHESRSVVTLNNMGTAYCPYMIRRQDEFFRELQNCGYHTIETWHHPGKRCEIPFHVPGGAITYRGGYFEREER